MTNVDFFHERLGRLKVVLRAGKDKEVAEVLGLSEKAFNARKARDSFPEKELRVLAQQRPELGIDVEYVLTGGTLTPNQRHNTDLTEQFTRSLRDVNEAQREHLLQLNEQAKLAMAATNVRRQVIKDEAAELLGAYRNDETAELALLLLKKLYRAELVEEKGNAE